MFKILIRVVTLKMLRSSHEHIELFEFKNKLFKFFFFLLCTN